MQNNLREIEFMPSTLKTIDLAVKNWLDALNLFCMTNSGWKKVPVVWTSAERSFQIKNDQNVRDNNGTLILPLISVFRSGEEKSNSFKGSAMMDIPANGDEKGGSITIARRIMQEKTSNFANAASLHFHGQLNFPRKSEQIVYETINIPMPIYVTVKYNISIKTEYQSQMNALQGPFMTFNGNINYFVINHDGHQFEVFIGEGHEDSGNIKNIENEQRIFIKTVSLRVLGYLIGEEDNQKKPKIVIRENAVQVKLPREQVALGEIPETGKKSFYRP